MKVEAVLGAATARREHLLTGWQSIMQRINSRRIAPRRAKSGAYLKTWGSTTPAKQARRAAG